MASSRHPKKHALPTAGHQPALRSLDQLGGIRDALAARQRAIQAEQAESKRGAEQAGREAHLFELTVGRVTPLVQNGRLPFIAPAVEPLPFQHIADEQAALMASLSDEFTAETLMETDAGLSYVRSGVGPDILRRLRRGEWSIQKQLDLHGLRRDEAREAVQDFLRMANRNGWRCVRVVHGKGLGSVNREPVLKNKVKIWLAQSDSVIAFCQATAPDGGAGALIVLLNGKSAVRP